MARKRQSQVLDPLEEAARRDREQQADVSSSSPDQYGRPFRRMIAERANRARQAGKSVFRTFSDSSARQDLEYPSKPKAKPIDNKRLQEAVAPDTERARVYPEVDPNAVKLLPPVDDVTPIRKPSNKGIKLLPPVTNQRQPQRDSRLPSGNTRASMEMPATQQSSVQPVAFTSPQAWAGPASQQQPQAGQQQPQTEVQQPIEVLPAPRVENVPAVDSWAALSEAPPFNPQQPPPPRVTLGNPFAPPKINIPQSAMDLTPAYDRQAFNDPSGQFDRMEPPQSLPQFDAWNQRLVEAYENEQAQANDVLARLADVYASERKRSQDLRAQASRGHILHYLVPGRRNELDRLSEQSYDRAMQALLASRDFNKRLETATTGGDLTAGMYNSIGGLDSSQIAMLQARPQAAEALARAATVPAPALAQANNLSALGEQLTREAAAMRGVPSDRQVIARNMADAQQSMSQGAQGAVTQGMATDPVGTARRMGLSPQMGAVAGGMQLGIPYSMPADENINPFYGSPPDKGTGGVVFGDQTMGITAQWLQEQIGNMPAVGGPSKVASTLANTPSVREFALSVARQTGGDVQRTQDALDDYIGTAIYTKLFESACGDLNQQQAAGLRQFVRNMMAGVAQEAAARAR